MNVSFTDKQVQYIAAQLAFGDYQNAFKAVDDAPHLHELYCQKALEELRAEIANGWDGSWSKPSVSDVVKAKAKAYKS